ncbi:MAG TPA: hypothetical protein VLL52_22115 [Anaerolineae bacterium]|nr:hypothetical protein [Anaerolineae bacterium]
MKKFALLLIIAILISTAQPTYAQSNINLDVVVGFDGMYKGPYWVPIHATITNNGADINGQVRIITEQGGNETIYANPISLPNQSNKRTTLYAYLGAYTTSLNIQLVDDAGRVVATNGKSIRHLNEQELLVGVVSDETGHLDHLYDIPGSRFNSGAVAYLQPEHIPNIATGLKALNMLVFNDIDTGQLTPDQVNAVLNWVDLGGQLIITGGPGWQKTAASFTDYLPVTPDGLESVADLPALSTALGQSFRDPGPYLITTSSLRQGELDLYQDNTPILAHRTYGRGHINYLALDPKLAPILDWSGRDNLWQIIAKRAPQPALWERGAVNYNSATNAVGSLPNLALPSIIFLFCFLSIYIIIIGPANYFVLRNRGHRELAWLTIPLIVIIFSVTTYVVGFGLKGNTSIANQMSVVYGHVDGQQWQAISTIGLYSPRRAYYDLSVDTQASLRPFNENYGSVTIGGDTTVIRDNDVTLKDVLVNVSGLRTFVAEQLIPPLPISVQADIIRDGGIQLVLDISNNTDYDIINPSIIIGSSHRQIADIPANSSIIETVALASSLNNYTGQLNPDIIFDDNTGYYYYDVNDENYARYEFINAINDGYYGGNVTTFTSPTDTNMGTLIAWLATGPQVDLTVNTNRSVDEMGESLYFIDFPVNSNWQDDGILYLATTSSYEFEILTTSSSVAANPPYQLSLPSYNWAEMAFTPPAEYHSATVDDLALSIALADIGWSPDTPTVQLYHWADEEWVDQQMTSWNEPITINNPSQFLNDQNGIRLRIENQTDYYLDFATITPVMVGTVN